MKTFLLMNIKGEIIERSGKDEAEVRHWAINHLDMSLVWTIYLKG